jgi:hypothetical protein
MSPLLELLNEMRRHPAAVYVGETSLPLLAAFLRGCDFAIHRLLPSRDDLLLEEFRDWVQARFHRSDVGWEHLIQMHSADDLAAVRRFWELLDQFLKERNGAGFSAERTAPPPMAEADPGPSVPGGRSAG